eukprot:922440-Amphidinium_carterae.1
MKGTGTSTAVPNFATQANMGASRGRSQSRTAAAKQSLPNPDLNSMGLTALAASSSPSQPINHCFLLM